MSFLYNRDVHRLTANEAFQRGHPGAYEPQFLLLGRFRAGARVGKSRPRPAPGSVCSSDASDSLTDGARGTTAPRFARRCDDLERTLGRKRPAFHGDPVLSTAASFPVFYLI